MLGVKQTEQSGWYVPAITLPKRGGNSRGMGGSSFGPEVALAYDWAGLLYGSWNVIEEAEVAVRSSATEASPIGTEQTINVSILSHSRLFGDGLASLLLLHPNIQAAGVYSTEPFVVTPGPKSNRHVILLDGGLGQERVCVV